MKAAMQNIRCDCGALPDPRESWGCGQFCEDGKQKFICYTCWCRLNYGAGSIEHLEAKADRTMTVQAEETGE